jgi:parallel beta-helix repeat protein
MASAFRQSGIDLKRMTRLLAAAAMVIALVALPYRAAAAGPWFVDGTLGNDGNSCLAPGLSACRTIQAAINKASPGDTINVAAGVYPEAAAGPLTVNKRLTLLGQQNGVDARGRAAAESDVTDSQGTFVTANNVVIDGFTFENSTNSAFTGYGIAMGAGTTGTQLVNNIVQNNIAGIALSNSGGVPVLIQHNQIQTNNQSGGASGTGIYTDQFVSGGAVKDVLIKENVFIGNADAGIEVSNTDAANGVSNLEVATNTFNGNGRAIVLLNTHMSSIHDNTITNNTFVGSAAIRLFDNNTALSIMNNNLTDGRGHAIRLSFLGLVGGASSGVVINENNIGVVGSANFALDGLLVDTDSHVGTVNAECNWWGSSTGPISTTNPGGTGEEVVGDADFTPWLIAPAPGGACLGGVPSTPGKVTGGGQIPGDDPLFSPT